MEYRRALASNTYKGTTEMRYLKIIATLAAAIACTADCPADNLIPAKLTIADAVGIAMAVHPDLKQAEENRKTSQSSLRIAGLNSTLNVGSNTNLDRQSGNSDLDSLVFSKMSYENAFGTSASFTVSPLGLGNQTGGLGVSLRQALRKGSGLLSTKGLALESAKSSLDIETKQLFLSRQATVQGVIEAYYDAVMAREEVKVREQAVDYAEEAAKGWREREIAGMAAGIDVTRSEIQVSQTKNALNSQQRTARNAMDKLMIAIGGGIGEAPELVDNVPAVDESTLPSLGDAVKKALENRAELSVYDDRLSDQRRSIASAKDQLRPQLDLVAGFNGSRTSEGFISQSILDSGLFTAGVEYTLPLDRRITVEKSETAARQLDVLKTQRLYEMDQITEQVRSAYRRVESARASIDILAQNKTQAEDNLRLANSMMDEGEGSSRDVLDAQQALTEVQSDLLSANTDLYLATVDLKRSMGEDITQTEFK